MKDLRIKAGSNLDDMYHVMILIPEGLIEIDSLFFFLFSSLNPRIPGDDLCKLHALKKIDL